LKRNSALLLLFFLLVGSLSAQQYRKDEDNEKPGTIPQKVGVRIGLGRYWLNAPEMAKGNGQFGVQGAVYYRFGLHKRLDLNIELGACYRGSKFSGPDTGFYYSRLGLFYMEMPIQAIISLDKNKTHNIMVGPAFSYLVKPSLFIRKDYYPAFTTMPIKKWEISATLGYLYSTEYIGIYIGYKHGLNNLANGFDTFDVPRDFGNAAPSNLSDVHPSLSGVKTLMNRSIEFSLYF